MSSQFPLPLNVGNPESTPESIAHQIGLAQCALRPMTPLEILSFVEEVKGIFEQMMSGPYPYTRIEFAKHALLGQSKIRPMSAVEISEFLMELMGETPQHNQASAHFVFVPPSKGQKEYSEEEVLKSLTEHHSHISCLICGAKLKMITKAHTEKHGMSPDQYRARLNLDYDTPLICQEILNQRKEASEERLASKLSKDTVDETRASESDSSSMAGHIDQNFVQKKSPSLPRKKREYVSMPPPWLQKEYTWEEALQSLTAYSDHIVCLVCGTKMKMITKAHTEKHGMSPEQYRERFNIRHDIPLMCKDMLALRKDAFEKRQAWKDSPTYMAGQKKKKTAQQQVPGLTLGNTENVTSDVKVKRAESQNNNENR